MGHTDVVYVGERKRHLDKGFFVNGVELVVDVSAWPLKREKVHDFKIPSAKCLSQGESVEYSDLTYSSL
jgi:hypothetical protein